MANELASYAEILIICGLDVLNNISYKTMKYNYLLVSLWSTVSGLSGDSSSVGGLSSDGSTVGRLNSDGLVTYKSENFSSKEKKVHVSENICRSSHNAFLQFHYVYDVIYSHL